MNRWIGMACGMLALSQVAAAPMEMPVVGNISVRDNNADGVFDSVISQGQVSVGWRNVSGLGQRWIKRGVIEVDLDAFAASSRLESALLTFDVTSQSNYPQLEVWGYTADGVVELADASVGDVLIQTQVIDSNGEWQIDITPYVRQLLQQRRRYLGLNLRMASEGLTNTTFDDEMTFPGHQYESPVFGALKVVFDDTPSGPFSPPETLYQHHFRWGFPAIEQGLESQSNNQYGRIELIHDRLRMDQRTGLSLDARNELDWTVDLSGATQVALHFDHATLLDELHPLPDTYTDHFDGDGVAVSSDGVTWYRIVDANDLNVGATQTHYVVDLDTEIERIQQDYDAEFGFASQFKIRFQQFDNSAAPLDGREWSKLLLTGTPASAETDLYVSASAPSTSDVGQVLAYDLSFGNAGVDPAVGVVIELSMPVDLYLLDPPAGCERSGTQVTCFIGTVDAGTAGHLQLLVQPSQVGLMTLTAAVRNQQTDVAPGNNSIEIPLEVFSQTNLPPTVALAISPTLQIDEGDMIRAEVFELNDPNTFDTHTFDWDFGEGTLIAGPARFADMAYRDNGQYTVTLTATDNGGLFDSDSLTVTVLNVAPTVDAGSNLSGDMFTALDFSGQFLDPGDDTHSVIWDFGDGAQATGLSSSHAYTQAGSYTATLSVVDDDGGSGSAALQVDVLPVYFLEVTPAAETELAGFQGGPYKSDCAAFLLNNVQPASVQWQVLSSEPWLVATTSVGVTAARQSATVDLCLDPSADDLSPGDYLTTVTVTEIPSGLTHQRQVRLKISAAAGSLPFVFNFDNGLPGAEEGWEYYTSNTSVGRVQTVDGRLRMDVSANGNFNLSEAVVTMDLNGASGVTLDFFQSDHGDESHPMPESFSGHYNADGVAVSNDGVHWYRVLPSSSLEVSSAGQNFSVDLDAVVAAIQSNGNPEFNYSADFKIKFQQYDNYTYPTDGRQWDNITINGVKAGLQISPSTPLFLQVAVQDSAGCQNYEMTNTSDGHLSWNAATDANWLSVTPAAGLLGISARESVEVCWDGSTFDPGENRSGNVSFTTSLGESQLRTVQLQVLGDSPAVPYLQTFSSGLPGEPEGWSYYSSDPARGRITASTGRLRMDVQQSGSFNLNEAVLTLDLSGASNLVLRFFQSEYSDERHSLPLSFTGHRNGDGVALSADGVTWYRVLNASDLDSGSAGRQYMVDLDAEVSRIQSSFDADFDFGPAFKIKFQQYDNYPHSSDGRDWDDISVQRQP